MYYNMYNIHISFFSLSVEMYKYFYLGYKIWHFVKLLFNIYFSAPSNTVYFYEPCGILAS